MDKGFRLLWCCDGRGGLGGGGGEGSPGSPNHNSLGVPFGVDKAMYDGVGGGGSKIVPPPSPSQSHTALDKAVRSHRAAYMDTTASPVFCGAVLLWCAVLRCSAVRCVPCGICAVCCCALLWRDVGPAAQFGRCWAGASIPGRTGGGDLVGTWGGGGACQGFFPGGGGLGAKKLSTKNGPIRFSRRLIFVFSPDGPFGLWGGHAHPPRNGGTGRWPLPRQSPPLVCGPTLIPVPAEGPLHSGPHALSALDPLGTGDPLRAARWGSQSPASCSPSPLQPLVSPSLSPEPCALTPRS